MIVAMLMRSPRVICSGAATVPRKALPHKLCLAFLILFGLAMVRCSSRAMGSRSGRDGSYGGLDHMVEQE